MPQLPSAPVTMTDMLRNEIVALGGPTVELDPGHWSSLAARIESLADAAPPPPSFPLVANQVLALAGKPELDLNELVGVVQRDAAVATTLLRIANSPLFAPASPITTLRGAIGMLGTKIVVELVVGSAGRAFYEVATREELALFPSLWQTMFDEAMANAFTAGRLALDIPSARGERALLAGLLVDVGRPLALRILSGLIRSGMPRPDDAIVLATLDEVSRLIGRRMIAGMNLPEELRAACVPQPDMPTADAEIARLVGAIGAMQRRSPRIWTSAGEVRAAAEQLQLRPLVVRALFGQRIEYVRQAAELFATRSPR